jgi:hypothetical protein
MFHINDKVRVKNLCGGIWEGETGVVKKIINQIVYVRFIGSTQSFMWYELELSQEVIF